MFGTNLMCSGTTASNTCLLNRACVLLEQKLEREFLLFACYHHIHELFLKSLFEIKISMSLRVPKDSWKSNKAYNNQTSDVAESNKL